MKVTGRRLGWLTKSSKNDYDYDYENEAAKEYVQRIGMNQKNDAGMRGCPMDDPDSVEYADVENRLERDAVFRFDYVAKVIGLGENDFAVLREFHSVIEPHLETIVKRVYEKMFDFNAMKRHFVTKHHGFEGNAPESIDNVSLNHSQIHFRRKKLKEYFAKLSTSAGDETFAVLLDVIGHIHTPHKGSPTLAVPIVQITALLGFIDDQFAKAISKLKLKVADRVNLQRAYSKVFWVQNNMFIRHYTN